MKIYTRTGDRGTTALFGGGRVSKAHPRIEAYGTVDETNAQIGLARALLGDGPGAEALNPTLHALQTELFELGADLATPGGARPHVHRIEPAQVGQLEAWIDRFDADLPPLNNFILPAGTPVACALHVARTTCRRAERLTVAASETDEVNEQVIVYLNRLSDLLFVLARWANAAADIPDVTWQGSRRDPAA